MFTDKTFGGAIDTELWNHLHDGTITQIDGDVPGDVRLKIEIEYLRNMFSPTGECIYVTLRNCRRLQLVTPTESLSRAVSRKSVTILSAKGEDNALVIDSTAGDLVIEHDSFTLELDSGEPISVDQLAQASRQYWETLARDHPWAWPGFIVVLLVLVAGLIWLAGTLFW